MAAFGYSVGDFIAVVQLAYKVYDGCKTSVEEYKDIGRDVGNTHIVLSAIQRYWKEEESRGRTLIVAQQEDLKQLADNSESILEKIQGVLGKHRSLGDRGGLRDKLKWSLASFVRDIGPQRTALQENTHALAIFNATLTAENASGVADQQIKMLEAHGQLLKFLVTRLLAVKDITEDEDNSWQNIDAEFEAAGFNPSVVKRNRGFIRDWITTVIPEDGEKEITFETGLTIVENATANAKGITGTESVIAGLSIEEINKANETSPTPAPTEPSAVTTASTIVPPATSPPSEPPIRSVSVSSRRSQASTWQDLNTTDTDFVAQILAKVLKSKYGEDCDERYTLPIKRSFHHLDWTNRGWISFGEVQRYCREAGTLAGFSINELALGGLAKTMDTDNNNQVNRDEFIQIVTAVRLIILEQFNITHSIIGGTTEAAVVLKAFFDNSINESMLPPFWHHASCWDYPSNRSVGGYQHDLLSTKQLIAPLQANFTNAAFIATTHCNSQITGALNKWRVVLVGLPKEEAAEYIEALDNALKATAKFHNFDGQSFPNRVYPLDLLRVHTGMLALEQFEDLSGCPTSEVLELSKQCWDLLDPIVGFVYDLKPQSLKKVFLKKSAKVLFELGSTPPALAEWRRLRMLERSRRIASDLPKWEDMNKTSQKCREWLQAHDAQLDHQVKLAIECAKGLHRLQQDAVERSSVHAIRLRDISLVKLKRQGFRDPSTLLQVLVDGNLAIPASYFGVREKTTEPNWYTGHPILDITKDSTLRLEFHDWKICNKEFNSTSPKSLVGYFEFKVTDITNFKGQSLVKKWGPLVMLNSSPLKASNAQVSVEVAADWKSENKDWDTTKTGGLASTISLFPLPPGWEARRTKVNDIYFFNLEEKQATACLWWDPISSDVRGADLTPLPGGWTEVLDDGKLVYINGQGQKPQTRPTADGKSTFQAVIRPKEYSQLLDFFPRYLIDDYEKIGKPNAQAFPAWQRRAGLPKAS